MLPLRVERVYYATFVSSVSTFSVALLLPMVAVAKLVIKTFVEWKFKPHRSL